MNRQIYKMTLSDASDSITFYLLEVPIADDDITGTARNTTIDGNVYEDYLWLKKQWSQKWSIMCKDEYDKLRGIWKRQYTDSEVVSVKYFYGDNIYTDGEVEGNPLQINNDSEVYEGEIRGFSLLGNATQKTLSGKNLMPMAVSDNTTTRQNIFRIDLPVGSYVVSFDLSDITLGTNTSFTPYMKIADANNNNAVDVNLMTINSSTTAGRYFKTFAPSVDASALGASDVRIPQTQWNNGARCKLSNIQIESGSTATDYEQYCGGVPSPNPDFPQVVNTVSGEQTVKIVGKNLLDFDAFLTAGEATYTKSGDVYSITDSAYIYSRQYPLYLENGKTYTLSQEYQPQSSTAVRLDILKNGSTYASSYATDQNNLVKTFTADGSNYTLRVNWSVKTYPIMFNCPMLEISPSKTNFEPYQGQIYEVNLGKNLAEIVPKTSASNGILATYDATTGNITLSGTATTSYSLPFQTLDVNIPAGTYTLKQYGTLSHGRIGVNLRRADNTQITEQLVNTSTLSNTFTLTEPAQKIHLLTGGHVANESVEGTIQVMLQAGSTAGTFAKYKTPLELCKIGTYQDYIYKSGDKWYKHEAVGKINMADIVGWATSTGGSLYVTGFTSAYNAKVDITLSNIFTHDWTTWAGAGKFGITSSGNLWIMTGDTSVVDSNVSTWLASKSAIMFCILATPTDTEITDAELVGQLDALLAGSLYKGTNNIFLIPSAGADGTMTLDYRIDYEKETVVQDTTPILLDLTDDGIINACQCRQNVKITMRETVQ